MFSSKDARVIAIQGRFDAQQARSTNDDIQAALQQTSNLVLDLSGAHFVDSAALALLVRTMKQCRQAGGDLRLCGVQPPVRYIFELTRLDRAFTFFPNQEAAFHSFTTNGE